MRTLLTEVQQIENHLLQLNQPGDALVFEAKLILDHELRDKVLLQSQGYAFVNYYSRKQLKQEIAAVHQKLFTQPEHRGFKTRILNLFKTK